MRFFYSVCRVSLNDAGSFGALIGHACYKREKNIDLIAAFFLFMGTSPINLALLGGNGNTLNKRRHLPHPPSFSLQTTALPLAVTGWIYLIYIIRSVKNMALISFTDSFENSVLSPILMSYEVVLRRVGTNKGFCSV
jgi:hypothetical protein